MAKKVHKLKNVVPEAFKVICIASHQNDYRLSWAINDKLNLKLKRTQDHHIEIPQSGVDQSFSHYSSESEEFFATYHLISNKSEQGYLLKNMQNIDYFLKISGELENISIPELVVKLKEIPIVITAFQMEKFTPQQVKRLSF
mgnify:FL=1